MGFGAERLPSEIHDLAEAFDRGLTNALGKNLAGFLLLGSSSMETRRMRHVGDIDSPS